MNDIKAILADGDLTGLMADADESATVFFTVAGEEHNGTITGGYYRFGASVWSTVEDTTDGEISTAFMKYDSEDQASECLKALLDHALLGIQAAQQLAVLSGDTISEPVVTHTLRGLDVLGTTQSERIYA